MMLILTNGMYSERVVASHYSSMAAFNSSKIELRHVHTHVSFNFAVCSTLHASLTTFPREYWWSRATIRLCFNEADGYTVSIACTSCSDCLDDHELELFSDKMR